MLGASGGVGQAAVQLARAMGARVLAGISRPERAAAVRAAGADAVIDLSRAGPARQPARAGLRRDRRARRRHHPRPARRRGIRGGDARARLARPAGGDRLCRRRAFRRMRTNYLLLKNIEVSGLQISDYRKRRPAAGRRLLRRDVRLLRTGQHQAGAGRRSFRWIGPARRSPRCATAASTGRAVLHMPSSSPVAVSCGDGRHGKEAAGILLPRLRPRGGHPLSPPVRDGVLATVAAFRRRADHRLAVA